jgi:hypothetical protein
VVKPSDRYLSRAKRRRSLIALKDTSFINLFRGIFLIFIVYTLGVVSPSRGDIGDYITLFRRKKLVSKKMAICILVALALLLQACGSKKDNANGELVVTQAMQTAEAKLTEMAKETPTGTVTPTSEPTPTASGTATATLTQAATAASGGVVASTACDVAGFVSDVTIPDGTQLAAGSEFVKTWRLRNDGTCTWTSSYQVVYYSGEVMASETSQQLTTDSVAPGESVDVSVNMVAPSVAGHYFSYWALRNASGAAFGIGSAGSPFYLDINVSGTAVAQSSTPTVTGSALANTPTPTGTKAPITSTSTNVPSTSTLTLTPEQTVAPYP